MSKDKIKSNSGENKQKKDPAPKGDSQAAAGGELHQVAGGDHPALITNQGVIISDNQNSLKDNPGCSKLVDGS